MIYRAHNGNLVGFGSWAPSHVEPYFPAYTLPQGLGMTFTIDTPVGSKSIKVPIKQIAEQAAREALDAAWPLVQEKLYQEIPPAVNKALDVAQPRIRKEVDRAVDLATSRAAMIATGLAVVMIGTAWWTRRAVKKGR